MRTVVVSLVLAWSHAAADECEPVQIWRDGALTETACTSTAVDEGLVVLDLGDEWTPPMLAADADGGEPAYRRTYLALAQERFGDAGSEGKLAERDRYLELFGVIPAPSVLLSRLADDERHACHDAIDDTALELQSDPITDESSATGRARVAKARALRKQLERARARKELTDLDALAETAPYYRRAVDRLTALEQRIAAIRAVQSHLACEGLVESRVTEGAYTKQTSAAVKTFQRGAMILPSGKLDAQTREAFLLGSRERDFRTALRVLRERVVAATGLIEDGSAGAGEGEVLGRTLVPALTRYPQGHEPLPAAAEDLISPATEAAATALGWHDADSVRAFLEAAGVSASYLVAVELPARPAYHTPTMDLSVEIDRGDNRRGHTRRPALILYTSIDGELVPLARWPTTIGGWQWDSKDGRIERRWKSSPVGPRVWRDLYVGPSWLPPESTPDRELVRRAGGKTVIARELLGPSYRAAFGIVAFFHLNGDATAYWDEGIRTHGTGSIASTATGVSHGCHRMVGHHVVRLATFVLAHRLHVRHGDTAKSYRRVVRAGGKRLPIAIDSLGYRIELVPPIPIEVLRGKIRR